MRSGRLNDTRTSRGFSNKRAVLDLLEAGLALQEVVVVVAGLDLVSALGVKLRMNG